MDQFIDLCILSGCDYCETIRGIGGKTALKLIHKHGSIEHILQNINKERYSIPDDWPYEEVRCIFKEPLVCANNKQFEVEWSAPDDEGLVTFLVNENGFSSNRVTKAIEKIKAARNKSSQGGLESLFMPVANTPIPIKRKATRCMLQYPKSTFNSKIFSSQVGTCSRPKGFSSMTPFLLHFKNSELFSRGVCSAI
ncbi:Flap endonuclease 1 [Hibiscus syriacus]|uniref:Flap endonuclease 1 n=2 Tax=Hibiscus syriacus TaxID=106335 RepID=A0A6A3ADU8_HIBSY|nr:Flap endonuclease 1 [Hibiscus syriacus]